MLDAVKMARKVLDVAVSAFEAQGGAILPG
jgi:hypothetical protein